MSNVKKKRSLLIYNILPYLALLLIFIFVFSWFFQNVLFSALKKEQAENSMISLNEYAYRTDANLRQISAIQNYILQVQDIRYVPNLESIPEAKSIIKTLSMYQIVHSDIEDIFLYFEGDRYVYSSSTTMPIDYFYERVFQSDNPEPVVPQTRQLKENNPPPYLPLYPYTGENKMLLFSPVYIRGVRANLIFYVDLEGWAGLEPDAAYFILDSEGRMISGRNIDPAWDLTNRIDTDKAEAPTWYASIRRSTATGFTDTCHLQVPLMTRSCAISCILSCFWLPWFWLLSLFWAWPLRLITGLYGTWCTWRPAYKGRLR